jgi:hypothetical protein
LDVRSKAENPGLHGIVSYSGKYRVQQELAVCPMVIERTRATWDLGMFIVLKKRLEKVQKKEFFFLSLTDLSGSMIQQERPSECS